MTTPHERLNDVLRDAGVSKTIYALVTPEIERVIDRVVDGGDRVDLIEQSMRDYFNGHAGEGNTDVADLARAVGDALSGSRESFRDMYREAWTQKQDSMHQEFFDVWRKWVSPAVNFDVEDFPFAYPTAGASEGLRESINTYASKARTEGFEPRIHVFSGEYEGFSSYAAAAGVPVSVHNRLNWQEAISKIGPKDQFYISHPSAIDGNVWPEFSEFSRALHERQPAASLMLDLTYVGCVADPLAIQADNPAIQAVFFSLSKPLGAYYHRIGGCLSKAEMPGLFGNKWFKNLLSLRVGTEFMKAHGMYDVPSKYKDAQREAAVQAGNRMGIDLRLSDVYMLATAECSGKPSDLESYLTRQADGGALIRVCLTPTMAKIIDSRIDNTVRARPHEGFGGKGPGGAG